MNSPAWALGYDLDLLKKHAAIFSRAHKPLVFGAFGLTKERDIASAMKSGGFFCNQKAAAIGHVLSRDSVHRDFTGRPIYLPAESLFIKALAGENVRACRELLHPLLKKHRVLTVEIFEEDIIEKSAVTSLTYFGTKVTAGSEIKGLYQNRYKVESIEGIDQANALTLEPIKKKFISEAERKGILFEVRQRIDEFAQHYSSYNKRKSWTAFALRGYAPRNPGFIIKPSEMSQGWKKEHLGREKMICQETQVARDFPTVWDVLRRIPCAGFERVRFMRLEAKKGELARHADITDPDAGTADGKIARLHIPIVTSPLVKFRSWNERGMTIEKTMDQGSLWYLDTRKPHSVVNEGDTVRIHLVVDAICNEKTRRWLLRRK